jgi:hypothetical protein
LAAEEVFRPKKPYAKPILSRIKTNDLPTLVRRDTNHAQDSSWTWPSNVLIVQGYRSRLLGLVEPLQNHGFSLEWSSIFEEDEVLKIRPPKQDRGSPPNQSLVVDLRSSPSGTKSLLGWVNKAFEMPPALLVLLSRRENVMPLEKDSSLRNCWHSEQLVVPVELAALLKSLLGIGLALRKSRLVGALARPQIL